MSLRLVLDTNILVSALRSKHGASRELLKRVLNDSNWVLLASVPLFFEYESVLTRPEHLQDTGLLTPDLIGEFLDDIALSIEPVTVSYLWRPQLNDPADEMVLEAAVNGEADWIITHNVRDFAGVSKKFKVGISGPGPIIQMYTEESSNASN